MTTFVAFPDIHDRPDRIRDVRHVLADVDAVLLPGDMTNGLPDNLQRLLAIIETYNERIMAVCGNMDSEAMNMTLAREGQSLHRRHEMLDGIAVLGCGGALPFAGKYVFPEHQLAALLQDSLQGLAEDVPKVLVCHQPPYGTALDLVGGAHVGSHAVRAFIERVQPLVCFVGHIHEATGIDSIGRTQIINPGPIWQTGSYAFAEIEADQLLSLEIRRAESLQLDHPAEE
jgi:hypothetical protein